jgi:cobalt-zinc-cadmium efflux system outer membrane protein
MERTLTRLPLVVALAWLAGCVSVSRRDGADQVEQLVAQRLPSAFAWRTDPAGRAAIDARVAELVAAPLTPSSAFALAQLRNPQIAARYAELGIAQADVVEASRIGNPTLAVSTAQADGVRKTTTELGAPLADLLLLPSRRRLAEAEYVRAQQTIANALVDLGADTERDWYAAAGAEQVAAMRAAVSKAAAASAELAQRFYDAGNINALQLKLEQAAASQARIAATSAQAEATRARLALNARMGLSGAQSQAWRLDVPLASPVAAEDDLDALLKLAHAQRLDLSAARREVEILSDALGVARRWRLLGSVEVGVETETGAKRVTGPTLSLALPLFNQGQAAIARAQAQLEISRADLAQLELAIDNDVRLGVERVAAMRGIAQDYRDALVPQREAAVARQLERFNYMLIGAFELLLTKQQEYDAYQGYLEAVRDYWLARVDLARAIGTRLPSETAIGERTIGVEAIVAPPQAGEGHGGVDHSTMDHSKPDPGEADHAKMDHSKMDHSRMDHSGPAPKATQDDAKHDEHGDHR